MRGNAGMLVVVAALSGCAVMREPNGPERAPAAVRTPGPAAQTAWKQYNMMLSAQANTTSGAKPAATDVAGKGVAPQSPWPTSNNPGTKTAAQANAMDPASGTLVSATFVETPREPAPAKENKTSPVAAVTGGVASTAAAEPARVTQPAAAKPTPPTPPPAPRPLPEIVQTSDVLPPPEPPVLPPQPTGPEIRQASAITPQTPSGPAVRMVNNKRIHLNYELKDVGESGVSGVELWYTQDTRTWKKYEGMTQAQGPYVVDVDGEGLFGFTMVARSGVGYSRELPQAGELPQVWVEVDLTRPVVQITAADLHSTPKAQNLVITWTAADKNLTARPITLSYAEKADGPWTPIAANLENTGKHEWPLPASVPQRIFVKVEATDLVGHIGAAQTVNTVLIDRARPTVSILTVDADKKEK